LHPLRWAFLTRPQRTGSSNTYSKRVKMQLPPISEVLQWPTPNYAHPETHGSALLVVNIIFIILVLVAVVGRFYARIIYKKCFGIDDVACVLALVSGLHCRMELC